MKSRTLLFAAIIVLCFVGCRKEAAYKSCAADRYFPQTDSLSRQSERQGWNRQTFREALAGKWHLIKSEGGGSGFPNVDYERCDNIRLEIPVSGPCKSFLNDTLVAVTGFTIDSFRTLPYPANFYVSDTPYTDFLNGSICLSGDYMICGNAGGDGTDYYYKRDGRL